MDWLELKNSIYYQDGSLRDIYIRNVSRVHWNTIINHLNSSYDVDFEIEGASKENGIDFGSVVANWESIVYKTLSATIRLGDIIIKTYFFTEDEIEFDITPKEIDTFEDHNTLIDFLKDISNVLGKTVELTEECYHDSGKVLITVDGQDVTFQNN